MSVNNSTKYVLQDLIIFSISIIVFLSWKLIEKHDGYITVKNNPTRFTITLPIGKKDE